MKGKPGDGATQAKPFKATHENGAWRVVAGVRTGSRIYRALELSILAPVLATPAGGLVGIGVVTRRGDTVVITA